MEYGWDNGISHRWADGFDLTQRNEWPIYGDSDQQPYELYIESGYGGGAGQYGTSDGYDHSDTINELHRWCR